MKNFLDLKECFNPSNKNPYTVCRTRYTSALAGLIRNLKLAGGWCNEKTGIHYNPQHSLGDWYCNRSISEAAKAIYDTELRLVRVLGACDLNAAQEIVEAFDDVTQGSWFDELMKEGLAMEDFVLGGMPVI